MFKSTVKVVVSKNKKKKFTTCSSIGRPIVVRNLLYNVAFYIILLLFSLNAFPFYGDKSQWFAFFAFVPNGICIALFPLL